MEYRLSRKENIKYIASGLGCLGVISYLFYRSIIAFIILSPLIILYMKFIKKELIKKRLEKLNYQFKDAIISISASLSTGYSLENSIKECYKEMNLLHGEDSLICIELKNMIRQIGLNIRIENIFEEFAGRTGLEDIEIFSSILQIAKKGGGDLIGIIKNTSGAISEKSDLNREIQSVISSKKYEQRIMNLIPLFIILYVDFASPGLITKLYHNFIGVMVMTFCLILYGLSFLLSIKITQIEV